jgi:hypothetical protein
MNEFAPALGRVSGFGEVPSELGGDSDAGMSLLLLLLGGV